MAITAGSDILASDFIATSAGAGDASKGVKLNSDGQLDSTFFLGKPYINMTAGPAITAGQAVCVCPYQSDGGILFQSKGTFTSSTGGSVDAGSTANRVMVAIVSPTTASATVTSLSYNGVAMTVVDTGNTSMTGAQGVPKTFILVGPASGSNTLTAVISSGTCHILWAVYYNCKQTAQPDGHGMNQGANTTTATVADGSLVAGFVMGGTTTFLGNDGTSGYTNSQTVSDVLMTDSGQVFPAGVNITATAHTPTSRWGTATISIAPFTAPVQGTVSPTSTVTATNQYFDKYTGFIGFAKSSVSSGAAVVVVTAGVFEGASGLSIFGKQYYLQDTAGTIGLTVGTVTRKAGIALSATKLLVTNIW